MMAITLKVLKPHKLKKENTPTTFVSGNYWWL
jgi:hypothetical protein